MGFDFLSKAEFAAGLDDDLRGKAPPEYRIRHVPALGPPWSRAWNNKRRLRIGVGNPRLQDGLGDVVADRHARRLLGSENIF